MGDLVPSGFTPDTSQLILATTRQISAQVKYLTESQSACFEALSTNITNLFNAGLLRTFNDYNEKEDKRWAGYERRRETRDRETREAFERGIDNLTDVSQEQKELLKTQLEDNRKANKDMTKLFESVKASLDLALKGNTERARQARAAAVKAEVGMDDKFALKDFGMGMASQSSTLSYLLKRFGGVSKESYEKDREARVQDARYSAIDEAIGGGGAYLKAAALADSAGSSYYDAQAAAINSMNPANLGRYSRAWNPGNGGFGAANPFQNSADIEYEIMGDDEGSKYRKGTYGKATAIVSDVAVLAPSEAAPALYIGSRIDNLAGLLTDDRKKTTAQGDDGGFLKGLGGLGGFTKLLPKLLPILEAAAAASGVIIGLLAMMKIGEAQSNVQGDMAARGLLQQANISAATYAKAAGVSEKSMFDLESVKQYIASQKPNYALYDALLQKVNGNTITADDYAKFTQLASEGNYNFNVLGGKVQGVKVVKTDKRDRSGSPIYSFIGKGGSGERALSAEDKQRLMTQSSLFQRWKDFGFAKGKPEELFDAYITAGNVFHEGGVVPSPRSGGKFAGPTDEMPALVKRGEVIQPADIAPLYKEIAENTERTAEVLSKDILTTLKTIKEDLNKAKEEKNVMPAPTVVRNTLLA